MNTSVIWTLLYNGTEQTLAEWGLCEPHITHANQQAGQLSFVQRGVLFDADLLFAYEDTVVLKRNGVNYFVGVVLEPERRGRNQSEEITYKFADAWWYLDNLIYQQSTKSYQGPDLPLLDVYSSHVFLGIYPNGIDLKTTGQTIQDVVAYAISCGVPIQLDTNNLPNIQIPFYDERDITCGEAIRKMLRFSPDAIAWVDNSTTPPTLRIKQRPNLTALTLDVSQGIAAEEITIHPRHDLQRPAVVINYEQSNNSDGTVFIAHDQDKWPLDATGREFRALVCTVNLQGYNATHAIQELVSAPLVINDEWWKARDAKLADSTLVDLVVGNSTRQTSLPYEIISGSVTQWMVDDLGFHVATDTFHAPYKFQLENGNIGHEVAAARINVTNCPTGRYMTVSQFTDGEPEPVGLAKAFYDATSFLQYEGSFTLVEEECSGTYSLGKRLNLTGSRVEWATMGAIIWQTDENLETGQTTGSFGPSVNLGVSDLIELLRVNRYRWTYTNPATQSSAQGGSASTIGLSKNMPKENTSSGGTHYEKFVMASLPTDPAGASQTGSLVLDATLLKDKQLYIREVEVCVKQNDGTTADMKIMTIASDPY